MTIVNLIRRVAREGDGRRRRERKESSAPGHTHFSDPAPTKSPRRGGDANENGNGAICMRPFSRRRVGAQQRRWPRTSHGCALPPFFFHCTLFAQRTITLRASSQPSLKNQWSSWYGFTQNINESLFRDIGDGLVTSGLAAAGHHPRAALANLRSKGKIDDRLLRCLRRPSGARKSARPRLGSKSKRVDADSKGLGGSNLDNLISLSAQLPGGGRSSPNFAVGAPASAHCTRRQFRKPARMFCTGAARPHLRARGCFCGGGGPTRY